MAAGSAILKGMAGVPTVNIREGAGLNFNLVAALPVGTSGLLVLDAEQDISGESFIDIMLQGSYPALFNWAALGVISAVTLLLVMLIWGRQFRRLT